MKVTVGAVAVKQVLTSYNISRNVTDVDLQREDCNDLRGVFEPFCFLFLQLCIVCE